MAIGPLRQWACSYRDPRIGRVAVTLYATSADEIDTRLAFDMRVDGEHVAAFTWDELSKLDGDSK